MTSVWVIEQGAYSDYRVVGVFSSRMYAEQALAILDVSDENATIDEWPLNPAIQELNAWLTQWTGAMLRDGTMEECRPTAAPSDLSLGLRIWKRSTVSSYKRQGVQDCLHGTVWAKNKTHAIKIFNEHRVQLIATNQWNLEGEVREGV